MKKNILAIMVFLLAVSLLAGCSNQQPHAEPSDTAQKPVVNFEGVVTAVEGDSIILESGTIVLITDGTVFSGDPDTYGVVSEDIRIGNYIQGYTEDDAKETQITAKNIWTNQSPSSAGGKMMVNFEGRVVQMKDNTVTLDNGQTVRVAGETAVTAPDGSSAEIAVGDYIQGYTENLEDGDITALYILVTIL